MRKLIIMEVAFVAIILASAVDGFANTALRFVASPHNYIYSIIFFTVVAAILAFNHQQRLSDFFEDASEVIQMEAEDDEEGKDEE